MNKDVGLGKGIEKKTKSKLVKIITSVTVAVLLCCCIALTLGIYQNSTPEGKIRLTKRAQEKEVVSTVEETKVAILNTSEPTGIPSPTSLLPEYTVFSDKSYEDAGTVKIIWEILVSPDIEKESLNTLLNELYVEALSKTSNSNGRSIVIDIKAYTSEEHATSGMAQWIGWVSKNGGDTEPTFSFNEGQLDSINETPEMKFGLSETARQQIWEGIVQAEDKAEKEALQQYPDMQPFNEFEKLENELVLKYKLELAEETGLTLEQLDEIAVEGLMKNWAFPQE